MDGSMPSRGKTKSVAMDFFLQCKVAKVVIPFGMAILTMLNDAMLA